MRWTTVISSAPRTAAAPIRPIVFWIMATIWPTGWALRPPGCSACRTDSPSCTARPAGVGLVFDVADLIKDAVILPQAISATRGDDEQTFRHACIESLSRTESLDFMIDTVKAVASEMGNRAR